MSNYEILLYSKKVFDIIKLVWFFNLIQSMKIKIKKILSIVSIIALTFSAFSFQALNAAWITTVAIYNDDLTDSTWSDYDNEQAAVNSSGVIVIRTKTAYTWWTTITIDLSELVSVDWLATWTVISRVATYTGSVSNAVKLLPTPDSASWTQPDNNFEDDWSVANQCTLEFDSITCTVPAWENLPKYSWIMLSWIQITNDSISTSWQWDSAYIVNVTIWWTAWDTAVMRVAIIRTGETWQTDWEAEGSAVLDVEILSSISITVEQPSNLIIQPAAWNADRATSTWTVTVTTNTNGWYSVSTRNDWTGNTLRNIVDESIVIPELPITGTTSVAWLQDNGFGVCYDDDDNTMCEFWTGTFYWVWASWRELYQDLDEEDTTAEVTYHIDVPATQKVGTYQGVVTYLAAVNL